MLSLKQLLDGHIGSGIKPSSLPGYLKLIQKKVEFYFPEGDPRAVVANLSSEELLKRMHELREEIKERGIFFESFLPIWSDLDIDKDEIFMDVIRIRCVPDKFHENTNAKSVAYIHRDPWYANPQCQLNLWIPIYSVAKGSGFRIYQEYFNKPIPNNSHTFDYNQWLLLGGFQSNHTPPGKIRIFPSPNYNPDETNVIDIHGDEGELNIFSSHHLHGTSPNHSGLARFTLEVRFVLQSHLENRMGPKKLDNRSKGSTLRHMYDIKNNKSVTESLIKYYEDSFVHP